MRFVVQGAFDRIHKLFAGTDKTILLVGHGNNGKALLKLLLNDPLQGVREMNNIGIWMAEEQPDGHFKLEMYNDAPYVKKDAATR